MICRTEKLLKESILTVITDISRFWFILAALYILFRTVDNSLAEYSYRKKLRRGQGRFFGYLTVVRSANPEIVGQRFGLKWENSLGSGKRCDIFLKDESIDKNHAVVSVHKDGAFVSPKGQNAVKVNDKRIEKFEELADGDEIRLGGAVLRLRMDGGGK